MFVRMCVALAALALVSGCSQDPYAHWKGLDALYASQVPLPKDAHFENAMGGTYYGEDLNDVVSKTCAYWFETKETPEKLIAFYEQTFPNATKETDDEGQTSFKFLPAGGEEGEEVYILVRNDGKIQIGEEWKLGKKKTDNDAF